MAKFKPSQKVEGAVTGFVPVGKVTAVDVPQTAERPVPPWGAENPNLYGMYGAGKELYEKVGEPAMKGLGLAGGGLVGGPVGAGLGYAFMKKLGEEVGEGIDFIGGEKIEPQSLKESLVQSGADVAEGATAEMGGRALPELAIKGAGIGGQVLGKLTGTGTGAVKEAFKSGAAHTKTMFDKALRGKITAQEVVGVARDALTKIKDTRSAQYLKSLAKIGESSPKIDIKPVTKKLDDLLGQYNIKLDINAEGKMLLDTSRVAMGKKGIRDIREVIKKVKEWGTNPEDYTAKGLDTLKRQLDDFYSDSGQARQFVTSLKNKIKDTISKAVPEYQKMTSKYAEASQLIKDIESNLMMRKQGMSGRIVADQTLRRLMSAMKDNFELRGELVGLLTDKGGRDVMGAVAGHTMRSWVPRGLAGSGPALTGQAVLGVLNPKFLPIVVASSPRLAAEFVRMIGKFSKEAIAGIGAAGRVGPLQMPKIPPMPAETQEEKKPLPVKLPMLKIEKETKSSEGLPKGLTEDRILKLLDKYDTTREEIIKRYKEEKNG